MVKELVDYQLFCGSALNDQPVGCEERNSENNATRHVSRISVEEYHKLAQQNQPHVLVDVRTEPEMEICSLRGAVNVPLEEIQNKASIEKIRIAIKQHNLTNKECTSDEASEQTRVVVVCRRGNDSQRAAKIIKEQLRPTLETGECTNAQKPDSDLFIQDIIGGLHVWAKRIDSDFPVY